MKFTRHFYPLFLLFIMQLFNACTPDDYEVFGKQPIYSNGDSLYVIQNIDTQLIVNAGNIYSWNEYLFINEVYKGIHVIDKSDSSNPVKLTFIKIIGNRNFTISDNTLLADNGKDLIAIDISDVLNVSVLSIVKDGIVNYNNYPPAYNGRFECVDLRKGLLVGWKDTLLINPKCYKPN